METLVRACLSRFFVCVCLAAEGEFLNDCLVTRAVCSLFAGGEGEEINGSVSSKLPGFV